MRRSHNRGFFYLLPIIILLATGCSSITYKDIIPRQLENASKANPQFKGTVEVHSIIKPERMGYSIFEDLPINAYVNNAMLETALKESVANSALFTRVEQRNADYVLDVWVDDVESQQPLLGIGNYGAKVFSIWRLTRVRDGKVLVCDFVDGSGLINTMVSAPRTRGLAAALQDVIQNGLRILSDTSEEHFSANAVAGIRPSMGSAVPEGLREWEEKVKKNWSNLREGLSLEEVESIIGPVRTSGALVRIYQKFKTWHQPFDNTATFYCRVGEKNRFLYKQRILFDRSSVTFFDEDYMGNGILVEQPGCKTFPYYEEHSYSCHKNPPNCHPLGDILPRYIPNFDCSAFFDTMNKISMRSYYMTHLYVLKFDPGGLQTWALR